MLFNLQNQTAERSLSDFQTNLEVVKSRIQTEIDIPFAWKKEAILLHFDRNPLANENWIYHLFTNNFP